MPLLTLVVVIACLVAASPAGAADPTLFVDRESLGGACSDARPVEAVSAVTPWCSLEQAVALAPSGSIVGVRGGNYPTLTVQGSQSRSSAVTLRADGLAVLDGATISNSSLLRLEGFVFPDRVKIVGGSDIAIAGSDVTLPGPGNGIEVRGGAQRVLIERNTIHDIPEEPGDGVSGYGIRAVDNVANLVIAGNNITRAGVDGIQTADVAGIHIEGNEISHVRAASGSDAHADPIQVFDPEGTSTVIRGNWIHHNEHAVLLHDGQHGLVVENNAIAHTENWAMKVGDAPGARFANNTFWDNDYGGLVLTEESGNPLDFSDVTFINNIIQSMSNDDIGFAVEDYNIIGDGSGTGPHDSSTAPRFAGGSSHPYALAAGSPGIDAGTSDHGAPERDLFGWARHDVPAVANIGAGAVRFVDLGAYEHGAGPATTLPAAPNDQKSTMTSKRCGRRVLRRLRVGTPRKARRLRRRGLALVVRPPRCAESARITLIRRERGRRRRVAVALVRVKKPGRVVLRVRSPRMLRALRPGRYVLAIRYRPTAP